MVTLERRPQQLQSVISASWAAHNAMMTSSTLSVDTVGKETMSKTSKIFMAHLTWILSYTAHFCEHFNGPLLCTQWFIKPATNATECKWQEKINSRNNMKLLLTWHTDECESHITWSNSNFMSHCLTLPNVSLTVHCFTLSNVSLCQVPSHC